MSLENGKCPSCGGTLILDASKEKAVCRFCGHEVVIQQAIQKVTIDGIASFDTLLLSAQEAMDYDKDYDKARDKFKAALDLKPQDYRVLWGLYLCEIAGIIWAKYYHGFVQFPGDIPDNVAKATQKYGNRAYSYAPDDVKPYYYRIMQKNTAEITNPVVEQEKKGCYIATCVYGSYDCPEVWTLRRYRDYKLAKTWFGRAFIHTYYAISPTLVKWFGKTKWFKKLWQSKLDRMVAKLQKQGFDNTPYED